MPKYGNIPTRLKVFLRAAIQFKRPHGDAVQCCPAFVTDLDRPKTHDTARRWAGRAQYNPSYAVVYPNTKVEGLGQDNKPIPSVTLVGTDARQEGGFAFKVVTPEGWLVDLRKEEFYEVLFKKGIPKSGKMVGPFQWVVNGSQMRLTLVGSRLYKEIEELSKIRKKPRKGKLGIRDLEVGGVYTSQGGNNYGCDAVFLGRARFDGKLKCAWVYVAGHYSSVAGYQTAYQRALKEGWNRPVVVLTSGCSYTECVGKVDLKPNPRESPMTEHVEFQDGYGTKLYRPRVTEW